MRPLLALVLACALNGCAMLDLLEVRSTAQAPAPAQAPATARAPAPAPAQKTEKSVKPAVTYTFMCLGMQDAEEHREQVAKRGGNERPCGG